MATTPIRTFSDAQLRPSGRAQEAYDTMLAVNLPASKHYLSGTVMGWITGTPGTMDARPAAGGALVAVPGAVTPAAAANGASGFLAGIYQVGLTWVNPQGETTLGATAPVTLTANQQIDVTAVPAFPATVTAANVYISGGPGDETMVYVQQIATNGNFSIVAPALANAKRPPTTNTAVTTGTGTETAVGLLMIECATDAAGLITYGPTAGADPLGATLLTAPVFTRGTFHPEDCVQSGAGSIDATALAQMNGRLIYGTLAAGQIDLG